MYKKKYSFKTTTSKYFLVFLDQIQVFLARNRATKLLGPISTSSQTVFPWLTNSPVYKSTYQITTDIIAKGEEQNINFWGRETVHDDHADQLCPLTACHQHFRFKTTTITMQLKRIQYKTHNALTSNLLFIWKDGSSDRNETKNYSSPRQDSSCFVTVDIS